MTRQAITYVTDTFGKELRSGRAAATVLKNFKRMTTCSANQSEVKKIQSCGV